MRRFFRYAWDTFKWVLIGMPKVPLSVKHERIGICLYCEFYSIQAEACMLCGCNIDSITSRANKSCPDNPPKWLPIKYIDDDFPDELII